MKKLNAYCQTQDTIEKSNGPLECLEVTLQGDPELLRTVAAFILSCADKLEKKPKDNYEHFHLQDEWGEWCDDYVDVIVSR